MLHEKDLIISRLRVLFVGSLAIASVLLVWLLVSSAAATSAHASSNVNSGSFLSTDMSDSPNIVSRGVFALANGFDRTTESTNEALSKVIRPISLPTLHLRWSLGSVGSVGHGFSNGLTTTTHTVGRGFAFVFHIPASIFGFVTHINIVSILVRPADQDQVPIIDPNSPELRAALAALPATSPTNASSPAQASLPTPQWPIHGAITTQFGVPEPPYQPIHTGLDISDGRRPGVTPIRPFRPGRVIEVVHSRLKLGNHVVIDHGNGVTSVYGHLNSTSAQVGQTVDEGTIIGYEGTTGVSTGPHLHFEIRVNGQAVDPHRFISGQP